MRPRERRAVEQPAVAPDAPDLGATLSRLMRTFARAKAAFISAARHDVEWSAYSLISQIVAEGPMRLSRLAGCLHSDLSTVSRQVAAMVKDGLIERRADPIDGRASLLVVTDKGRRVYDEHNRIRNESLTRMLSAWSDDDRQRLTVLLSRFADDLERSLPQFLAGARLPVIPDKAEHDKAEHDKAEHDKEDL